MSQQTYPIVTLFTAPDGRYEATFGRTIRRFSDWTKATVWLTKMWRAYC